MSMWRIPSYARSDAEAVMGEAGLRGSLVSLRLIVARSWLDSMDFHHKEFMVMLSILGRGATLCDGLNRREILRPGGLSIFRLKIRGLLLAVNRSRGKGIERQP